MNEIITKEKEIKNMIYEIRGKQVMLDSDLAQLYRCTNGTKSINLAVKRNVEKFPEDFCFRLNAVESKSIRFQSETKKTILIF
ncbi:MAG: ORF6N domain-containing protein [Bacilli bacterium]|nr:ORF6N domain-containing protein [Bacilli bacterium]